MAPHWKLIVRRFGEKLRHLRTRQGLTQTELARHLGLSGHAFISNVEAGRKGPSLEMVLQAVQLFQVSIDYLLLDSFPLELIQRAAQPIAPELRLFGSKLQQLRTEQRYTQADLAQQLGLASQAYISNLEAGRKLPSPEIVLQLAELFGVSTDYLLRDSIPVEDKAQDQRSE